MVIQIREYIDGIVSLLAWAAPRTETTWDDEMLLAAQAVQNSPELLAWVQSWLDKLADQPPGTQAVIAIPPAVAAIFEGQNLSIGGLVKLIQYLPQIIEMLRLMGVIPPKQSAA